MPIYEYKCESCGRTLEKRQKFSDAALTVCPYCGGHLEKTISAPAIQFKGGGWYADLYSSSKANKPAATGEGAPAASSSGEAAGTASSAGEGSAPAKPAVSSSDSASGASSPGKSSSGTASASASS